MSACSTERSEASTVSPLEVRLGRSCFTSVNVEVVHLLEKIRKLDGLVAIKESETLF